MSSVEKTWSNSARQGRLLSDIISLHSHSKKSEAGNTARWLKTFTTQACQSELDPQNPDKAGSCLLTSTGILWHMCPHMYITHIHMCRHTSTLFIYTNTQTSFIHISFIHTHHSHTYTIHTQTSLVHTSEILKKSELILEGEQLQDLKKQYFCSTVPSK